MTYRDPSAPEPRRMTWRDRAASLIIEHPVPFAILAIGAALTLVLVVLVVGVERLDAEHEAACHTLCERRGDIVLAVTSDACACVAEDGETARFVGTTFMRGDP